MGAPLERGRGMSESMCVASPFDSDAAIANSNYCAPSAGRLRHRDNSPVSALTSFVHESIKALTLNDQFTCVGAKAAVRQQAYRFGLYGELGSDAAAAGLAHDLWTFVDERRTIRSGFTTFLASFSDPAAVDEHTFERLLWQTLQKLHDLDAPHHAWDPAAAADPADPKFAFSFAGSAFYVVGLHAASSRATRRFAWPTLVFNPHEQFEDLRENGRYERFQAVIREAERSLQGDINPMLADWGEQSEAAQYSGRAVERGWTCPFHARREKP